MTPKDTLVDRAARLRQAFQNARPAGDLKFFLFDEKGQETTCIVPLPDEQPVERIAVMVGMKMYVENEDVESAFCVASPYGSADRAAIEYMENFGSEKAIKDGMLQPMIIIEGGTIDGLWNFQVFKDGELVGEDGFWEPAHEQEGATSSLISHFFFGYTGAAAASSDDAPAHLREQLNEVIKDVTSMEIGEWPPRES